MTRWSCVGVLGGLAVGACISIPTFKGGDAGTDSDGGGSCMPDLSGNGPGSVSFVDDNGGGLVTGSTYSVHFASGSEFHFPDDIRVNGVDIMSRRAQNCAQEDLAGVALYPAPAIRPNGTPPVRANDLTVKPGWGGPAIIKLLTHWQTHYLNCGVMPSGDSMFTFFPDGRIVRHDFMHSPDNLDWNDCQCNGGQDFYPTSYWTFERSQFTTLQVGTMPEVSTTGFMGPVTGQPHACLQGSGAVSVAAAWEPATGETTRVLGFNPSTIAFVFDWLQMHAVTVAGPFDMTTTSALFLGGSCSETATRALNFRSPNQLTINGIPQDPGAADGIYGGANDRTNTGGYSLTSMSAELRGDVPAFFAVWLRFPAPACDITITKDPPPGDGFYTKQQIDDDEWVIWFRDSLVSQHSITVTAK